MFMIIIMYDYYYVWLLLFMITIIYDYCYYCTFIQCRNLMIDLRLMKLSRWYQDIYALSTTPLEEALYKFSEWMNEFHLCCLLQWNPRCFRVVAWRSGTSQPLGTTIVRPLRRRSSQLLVPRSTTPSTPHRTFPYRRRSLAESVEQLSVESGDRHLNTEIKWKFHDALISWHTHFTTHSFHDTLIHQRRSWPINWGSNSHGK